MTVEITQPIEGRVVLDLSWDEACVAARAIGLVNSGNLKDNAPTLYEFVLSMVEVIGRNSASEAKEYVASIHGGQVYVDAVD